MSTPLISIATTQILHIEGIVGVKNNTGTKAVSLNPHIGIAGVMNVPAGGSDEWRVDFKISVFRDSSVANWVSLIMYVGLWNQGVHNPQDSFVYQQYISAGDFAVTVYGAAPASGDVFQTYLSVIKYGA